MQIWTCVRFLKTYGNAEMIPSSPSDSWEGGFVVPAAVDSLSEPLLAHPLRFVLPALSLALFFRAAPNAFG